jgi:hypothetical protein
VARRPCPHLGTAAAGLYRARCIALGVRSEAASAAPDGGSPSRGARRPTLSQTIPDVKELGSRGAGPRVFRPGDGRARTADPLLAKQVLSQLSYIPVLVVGRVIETVSTRRRRLRGADVGLSGFEPETSRLSAVRSHQLS